MSKDIIERYQHCIFVCSNYTNGTRTGLHFLYNSENYTEVMAIVDRYKNREGVAFYFVVTNNPTIESVQSKDKFFRSINILEGVNSANVIEFNNSINNQINVMDIALLLISRKKMTISDLKTYLFYVYCLYAKENNSFPFKEKCYFGPDMIGFKRINDEFKDKNENYGLECTNIAVVMSKFFNCVGGVELMNKVLKIFYYLTNKDLGYLKTKIENYSNICTKKYKLNKKKSRYAFNLRKKEIKALNINCE